MLARSVDQELSGVRQSELRQRWGGVSSLAGFGAVVATKSDEEMLEVGRLRYKRYVVDQQQPYQSTVRNDLALVDDIDRLSVNLALRDPKDRHISLAMRMSWVADIDANSYLSYAIAAIATPPPHHDWVVCSRLVTRAADPRLSAIVSLFRAGYTVAVHSGARFALLTTHKHRMPFFQRFGYRDAAYEIDDPVAGKQHAMVLDSWDLAHLESVSSPYLVVAKRLFGMRRLHDQQGDS